MIPKEHALDDPQDLKRLWFDVYDGPVRYAPLSVFEELRKVSDLLRMVAVHYKYPQLGGLSSEQLLAIQEWYERDSGS